MKITGVINESKGLFEVEIPKPPEAHTHQVGIAHDYVLFGARTALPTRRGLMINDRNWINTFNRVQVPITVMANTVLPRLNASEYLKPEHIKNYGYQAQERTLMFWDKDGPTQFLVTLSTGKEVSLTEEELKELKGL